MIPNSKPYAYSYSSMFVMPSFKRTVAILEETGYPVSMDDVSLEAVNVKYYEKGGRDVEGEAAPVVYTSRKELDAFKDALVPSGLMCVWMDYESRIDASFHIQSGIQDVYAFY